MGWARAFVSRLFHFTERVQNAQALIFKKSKNKAVVLGSRFVARMSNLAGRDQLLNIDRLTYHSGTFSLARMWQLYTMTSPKKSLKKRRRSRDLDSSWLL
ncbi:hypothetical protein CHS0354_025882 [Potamilus streckersoni]|uniref:Uncharacterized protein n=1 Tax=Potamilus streckersoni TaxID=2493646 RepID=A0AAE0WEK8_9BIVA|nr:hypothetical protein CHS0354_025882 [Potamilus streckersoni]